MRKKGFILLGITIYCFVLRYMFHVLFPFVLAIICYFMMKPMMINMEKKFQIHHSTIGISLLVAMNILLAAIFGGSLIYAIWFLKGVIENIPYYYQNMFLPFTQECIRILETSLPQLFNQDIILMLQNMSYQWMLDALLHLSQVLSQLPSFLFSIFLFIMSTFFLMLDYEQIREHSYTIFSRSLFQTCIQIKNQCMHSLWIYLKCQFLLMVVCFFVLWLGFLVLRFHHAFLYALLIALLDSLPFIGVGIALIPMCLFQIINKMYLKAFYIFLLYIILNLLRSFLEPHIMNKEMKIPSFILLLSMIIHMYFFGLIGIILSPVHLNLLYSMLDYYYHKS